MGVRMTNRVRALAIGFCLGAAALFASANAGALEPAFTQNRLSLGGGPRFGSNNLNFGLGARIGYTIEQSVYFGGVFDWWLGEHSETGAPLPTETHASAWNLMGDVGYDFGITPKFVIRAYGGAGIIQTSVETCATIPGFDEVCTDGSDTQGAGMFGAQPMVLLGDKLHLGGELRVMFSEEAAVIIAGNVGGVF